MKKSVIFLIILMFGFAIAGCSTVKKMTGQRDDSVLPGQREDILPPDKQVAQDPKVTGKKEAAPCDINDVNCVPPVDQESSTPQ
jgi:hypothetical protein